MRHPPRGPLRLFVSACLGLITCFGCAGSSSQPASAEQIGQYNEVRWSSTLDDEAQTDVAVRELLFPPGWTAPPHFHNSDLFIYVLKGEFEVAMEGADAAVYRDGEALEMRTEAQMTARNVSQSQSLKLVVFQVGQTQAPFVVPVEDPTP